MSKIHMIFTHYYKRRFGQVKPRDEEINRLTIELIGAFVAYFFIGLPLDIRLHSAVSITLLIFALFLLIHWWVFARARSRVLANASIISESTGAKAGTEEL